MDDAEIEHQMFLLAKDIKEVIYKYKPHISLPVLVSLAIAGLASTGSSNETILDFVRDQLQRHINVLNSMSDTTTKEV